MIDYREPNFMDKKWHLSTRGIWHKLRNKRMICNRALGQFKLESFDIDQSKEVCRNCIHLLTSSRSNK